MISVKTQIKMILIAIAIVSIPFYVSLFTETRHLREGCERLNATRVTLHNSLIESVTVERKVLNSNIPIPPVQRRLAKQNINVYVKNARDLEKAASEYAVKKNSPRVDCLKAYIQPFPINYLAD